MLEKDEANLLEIICSIEKISQFTETIFHAEDFTQNQLVYDAVMMNFVLIGEAVTRLSNELKTEYNFIDWKNIKGFRNLVVHDYFGVDEYEVWNIISAELPKLKTDIQKILAK